MKNKLDLFAVIFMAFGITALDFENLTLEHNYKPYIFLIISVILLIYSKIKNKKNK